MPHCARQGCRRGGGGGGRGAAEGVGGGTGEGGSLLATYGAVVERLGNAWVHQIRGVTTNQMRRRAHTGWSKGERKQYRRKRGEGAGPGAGRPTESNGYRHARWGRRPGHTCRAGPTATVHQAASGAPCWPPAMHEARAGGPPAPQEGSMLSLARRRPGQQPAGSRSASRVGHGMSWEPGRLGQQQQLRRGPPPSR